MTIVWRGDVEEVGLDVAGKNAISWVPERAPPLPLFRNWMRAKSGLISSISVSVGGESHKVNFFTSFEVSKGAMPYLSEDETLRSLI
jgi:hypothetical protein